MSDVLIRLAAPGEYEAIGELSEAAYSHDYDISDRYRESLRDVAARPAEHEVWVAVDRRRQAARRLARAAPRTPGQPSTATTGPCYGTTITLTPTAS